MKLNAIAAVTLFVCSSSVLAVGPGSLGFIDNTPIVFGQAVDAGLLFDVYSFSLADPGTLFGTAAPLNVSTVQNLPVIGVALQGTSGLVGSDADSSDGFSFANLGPGSYSLTVVGFATGSSGGAYSGVLFAQTSPIPEPESYVLLLAGLAAVGFVASRRQRH